ncbi:hypothetical protein, partial [Intestinimonas sp. HCP28S3_D6]|uniref:hypothetical protein n=1 Tax=Intestinimonas sp. HCP28S3_D6 TaxID=3438942 RepID=UPI003F8B6182
RQLSSPAPKILAWRRAGKIGSADTKNGLLRKSVFCMPKKMWAAMPPHESRGSKKPIGDLKPHKDPLLSFKRRGVARAASFHRLSRNEIYSTVFFYGLPLGRRTIFSSTFWCSLHPRFSSLLPCTCPSALRDFPFKIGFASGSRIMA